MKTIIHFQLIFILFVSCLKAYAYNPLLEIHTLFDNLDKFKHSHLSCNFELKKDSTVIAISTKNLKFLPYVFMLPNFEFDEMFIKGKRDQENECKLENQTITCKSEEAGQMPEHITQSYQHLELKLDQNGNIVNMHAYKIQKSFLFNTELKWLEKKYAEFYCPFKEQASKDQTSNNKEINNSTVIKEIKVNPQGPSHSSGSSALAQ